MSRSSKDVKCRVTKLECTSQRGDDQDAKCNAGNGREHKKYIATTPPAKDCSLGIGMDKQLACLDDSSTGSFCAPGPFDRDCQSITNAPVEILGRDDATSFKHAGFHSYGSKITITGQFSRLKSIGSFAFNDAGTADSLIEFGDGDLPVLVEIGFQAFEKFKGNVRFVGSCFPNLKRLLTSAFEAVAGPNSRVDLDDHHALEAIGQRAFQHFPTVTMRGSLPKLGKIFDLAFNNDKISTVDSQGNTVGTFMRCPSESIVELTNVPRLTSIGYGAFHAFCGYLKVGGILPVLEVIDRAAFLLAKDATIRLDQGAPALRCIGNKALSLTASSTGLPTNGTVVLAGSFPCLIISDDAAQDWNNGVGIVSPSTIATRQADDRLRINIAVRDSCGKYNPFADNECKTLRIDGGDICESRGGDHRFSPCDGSDWADSTLAVNQSKLCAFGLVPGGAGCRGEAAGACESADCGDLATDLIIGTNDKITSFDSFGFIRYTGTIKVHGHFKRLEEFGTAAFFSAGTSASSIVFGKGSLPVLVSIQVSAFANFRGSIRIASGAFPNLRIIAREAFKLAGSPASAGQHPSANKIELVEQHHLTRIHSNAFAGFAGAIIMKGEFPRLAGIDVSAFDMGDISSLEGGLDASDVSARIFNSRKSSIELINLPRLQLVGEGAFRNILGTVRVAGCFPMLREIQQHAFLNVANLTFSVPHGGPALSCIGGRPFAAGNPELLLQQHKMINLAGSFPCLTVVGAGDKTKQWYIPALFGDMWNDPTEIFRAYKRSLFNVSGDELSGISSQMGVSQGCRPFHQVDYNTGAVVPKERWCTDGASKCNAAFKTAEFKCGMTMDDLEIQEIGISLHLYDDDYNDYNETVDTGAPIPAPPPPSPGNNYGGNSNQGGDDAAPPGPGGVVGGVVAAVLFVVVVIAALRYRVSQREQSFGREIAAHIEKQALEFFVANFSHLLAGVDGSRSDAANGASRWLQATSLDGPTPRYKVTLAGVMGENRWYGSRYFGKLRATSKLNRAATAANQEYDGRMEDQSGHRQRQVHDVLPEDVVVKVCGAEIMAQQKINAADQEMLKRFCLEALLVGTLEHDSILKILRVQTTSLPFMVVTEHMQNGSLKDYLRSVRPAMNTRKKKLKVEDLLQIGLRLVQACEFLESRKVVHRAIMTKNVLVGRQVGGNDADAEVKSGRRLEHAEGCPYVLHEEMTKCWHATESRRPTFASLQGTMKLMLMKDADALRASVAAASKVSAESLEWLQWNVPNKGWGTFASTQSDCGMFALEAQQQGGGGVPRAPTSSSASKWRLALISSNPDEAAVLKTAFYVLQNLQHPHIVPLVGCNAGHVGGGFAVFFGLPLANSVCTLHNMLHAGAVGVVATPTPLEDTAAASAASQRQHLQSGYLVIGSTDEEETATDSAAAAAAPLHATVKGCFDLALQMALALEYVHANQIVHGRLSSHSFYLCDAGSTLRLLVGNTVATPAPSIASGACAEFPTDPELFAEVRKTGCLPPLSMDPLSTPESVVALFGACTQVNDFDRPWIANVATLLLDHN
eukprot:gene11476-10502_t